MLVIKTNMACDKCGFVDAEIETSGEYTTVGAVEHKLRARGWAKELEHGASGQLTAKWYCPDHKNGGEGIMDNEAFMVAETMFREAGPVFPGACLVLYSMVSRLAQNREVNTIRWFDLQNDYSAVKGYNNEAWRDTLLYWMNVEKKGVGYATPAEVRIYQLAKWAVYTDYWWVETFGERDNDGYLQLFRSLLKLLVGLDIPPVPMVFAMGGGLDVPEGSGVVTAASVDGTIELFADWPGNLLEAMKTKKDGKG